MRVFIPPSLNVSQLLFPPLSPPFSLCSPKPPSLLFPPLPPLSPPNCFISRSVFPDGCLVQPQIELAVANGHTQVAKALQSASASPRSNVGQLSVPTSSVSSPLRSTTTDSTSAPLSAGGMVGSSTSSGSSGRGAFIQPPPQPYVASTGSGDSSSRPASGSSAVDAYGGVNSAYGGGSEQQPRPNSVTPAPRSRKPKVLKTGSPGAIKVSPLLFALLGVRFSDSQTSIASLFA